VRISVEGLTKRFGALAAVSAVSLSIEEGEMFTLLGPSGCGKTTLLRLLAGFYAPDAGEIRFGNRVVNDVPPHERGIGMVFQNYALWPHMTVAENVSYGLKLRKVSASDRVARVEQVLAKVGLTGLADRYPGQLSGGQQQRVALARALVLNPLMLLLDEPLSNLDAKIRVQVRAEIRKLQKELGITAVYVTHDQEEALAMSDRIAVFDLGRVCQVGPPKALYERPTTRFVADFIGINNLVSGTVQSVEGPQRRLCAETALGQILAIYDEPLQPGDRCVICIRPENVAVNGQSGGERNHFKGKIAFSAYLGNTLRYDVDLGGGITFKTDVGDPWHHEQLPMGTPVALSCATGSTLAIPAD
jgi:ABC-type Fe3+/spermidine/putrescine transport system ATPase subunit